MSHTIQTRVEAAASGQTHYWTGRPCTKGHVALRTTAGGACVECVKGYRTKYRRNAPGFKPLLVLVHGDDVAALRDYADALKTARELDC